MTLLCVVANCRPMIGEHQRGCEDDRCRGCQPKLAAKPLQVCRACELRVLDELAALPRLYADLLTPTRSAAAGQKGKGAERPQTLGDEALKARSTLRVALVGWCLLLEEKPFALSPPADNVPAMARHLAASAPRVLASEHAERLAAEVDEIHHDARRRAYPAPPLGHVIGHCPEPDQWVENRACDGDVRALIDTMDGQGWANCMRCGTKAVIEWWQQRMPADHPEWMGMADLRWHLSIIHMQHVPEGTIKSWTQPRNETEPSKLPTRLTSEGRVQYHVPRAVELAKNRRIRRSPNWSTTTTR